MKKFFIIFSLVSYIFLALISNTYAMCGNSEAFFSKNVKITCICCHHCHHGNVSKNCTCFKPPVNSVNYCILRFDNSFTDIKAICSRYNSFSNLIKFSCLKSKDFLNSKTLALNKNLDMLKTVILLN